MGAPVFSHTIERIYAILEDDSQPLRAVSSLIKYDPGLFLSFLANCPSAHGDTEALTACQAATLMGSDVIRTLLACHTHHLDDADSLMLWHYATLAGEAAMRINKRASIAEDEEAFFAAILPYAGMMLMLDAAQGYRRLVPLLVKLSIEDRVFVENRIFNINHISILDSAPKLPAIYRDITRLIMKERFPSELRMLQPESASRFTTAYETAQLYRLSMCAENIAQAIFFPFIVLAEENFKRINKRFFSISENSAEELLTEIIENYETVCADFGQEEFAAQLIDAAIQYKAPESKFLTVSAPLLRTLNSLFAEKHMEKNIVISGEPGVGKRLLAKSLHYHSSNPRRMKPFLSFHCDTVERETLEEELLGAKGGYLGKDQHKGAFDIVDGGTIMLKDIDVMPMPIQERLAEIISHMDYYRARKLPEYPDVLFIVTSRQDLDEEARRGGFSKALLRALKPVFIRIPPLRERREDIGFIADGIITKYGLPLQKTPILVGLQAIYETDPLYENLSDLKRILFHTAAKEMLES